MRPVMVLADAVMQVKMYGPIRYVSPAGVVRGAWFPFVRQSVGVVVLPGDHFLMPCPLGRCACIRCSFIYKKTSVQGEGLRATNDERQQLDPQTETTPDNTRT